MGKEDMRSPDPKEFLLASDVERASEKHVLLNCPLFQQSSRQSFEAWKRLRAVLFGPQEISGSHFRAPGGHRSPTWAA